MILKKLDVQCKRIKLGFYFLPRTKINLKELNVNLKIIKLLEYKEEKSSLPSVLAMIFLDMTLKAQATKSKINKWDYIIIKSF